MITGLPPGHHHDAVAGSILIPRREPMSSASASRNCRDARARAVARYAVGDRCVHRFDDVRCGGDVDVAEVERVDPVALGRPGCRRLRDAEGGLGAKPFEPMREFCMLSPKVATTDGPRTQPKVLVYQLSIYKILGGFIPATTRPLNASEARSLLNLGAPPPGCGWGRPGLDRAGSVAGSAGFSGCGIGCGAFAAGGECVRVPG